MSVVVIMTMGKLIDRLLGRKEYKIYQIKEYLNKRSNVIINGKDWSLNTKTARWSHSPKALQWDEQTLAEIIYDCEMDLEGLSL